MYKSSASFKQTRLSALKKNAMGALGFYGKTVLLPTVSPRIRTRNAEPATIPHLSVQSMASQKPGSATPTAGTKNASKVFPLGEPYMSEQERGTNSTPIKLLSRVEKLRLLSKAEKAGLLSRAEELGLSLSSVEKLGLLSKAEELGVLSAATNPGTPGSLLALSLVLILLGPICVYVLPEDYAWEVVLQVVLALVSVVGGSAAFGASSFVSNLQKSA